MKNRLNYNFAIVLLSYPFTTHLSFTAYFFLILSGLISLFEIFKFFLIKKSLAKNSIIFIFFSSLLLIHSFLNYSKYSSLVLLCYLLLNSLYFNIFFNNSNPKKVLFTIDFIYKISILLALLFMFLDIFYPEYQLLIGFRADPNYPFLGSFNVFRAHGLFDEPSELSTFMASLLAIRIYICGVINKLSIENEYFNPNKNIISYLLIVLTTVSTSAFIYFITLLVILNFKNLSKLYISKKLLIALSLLIPLLGYSFYPILLKIIDFFTSSSARSLFISFESIDLPVGQGIGYLSNNGIYLPNLFFRLIIEQGFLISIIFYLFVLKRLLSPLYQITIIFILFSISSADISQPIFSLFLALPIFNLNKLKFLYFEKKQTNKEIFNYG